MNREGSDGVPAGLQHLAQGALPHCSRFPTSGRGGHYYFQ